MKVKVSYNLRHVSMKTAGRWEHVALLNTNQFFTHHTPTEVLRCDELNVETTDEQLMTLMLHRQLSPNIVYLQHRTSPPAQYITHTHTDINFLVRERWETDNKLHC